MKEGSRGLLMALLLHIPHSSKYIPDSYLPYFRLTPETLDNEILKMTDHYTDELFHEPNDDVRRLLFPVSRLLVDPETESHESYSIGLIDLMKLRSKFEG